MGAVCSSHRTHSPLRQDWRPVSNDTAGRALHYASVEGPLEEVVRRDRPEDANLMQKAERPAAVPEEQCERVQPTVDAPRSWTKGDLIGEGAFGKVYLGLNNDTGTLLAIKELPCPTKRNGRVLREIQAVEEEMKVLQHISHPNVVQYYGTAVQDDTLLIFLEYVAGGSITSLLANFGPFKEPVIRAFTRQILLGVEYLHKHKIMHRDIKGDNILLDNRGVIKLVDFGASKSMKQLATIDADASKSLKGTPFFMAPEIIKGTGHGRSADIWSVGCTVIEMATGKPPWSDVPDREQLPLMFKIATSTGPPTLPDFLSPECKDFLLLCFDRNPGLRANASRLLQHPFITNTMPPGQAYMSVHGLPTKQEQLAPPPRLHIPKLPSLIAEESSAQRPVPSPSLSPKAPPTMSPLGSGAAMVNQWQSPERASEVHHSVASAMPRSLHLQPSCSSVNDSCSDPQGNLVEEPAWLLSASFAPTLPRSQAARGAAAACLGTAAEAAAEVDPLTTSLASEHCHYDGHLTLDADCTLAATAASHDEVEILHFVRMKASQDLVRLSMPFKDRNHSQVVAFPQSAASANSLPDPFAREPSDDAALLVAVSEQLRCSADSSVSALDLDVSMRASMQQQWKQELHEEVERKKRGQGGQAGGPIRIDACTEPGMTREGLAQQRRLQAELELQQELDQRRRSYRA